MSKVQLPAKTGINYALLELIARHIETHPEEFDMGLWECGTTACIGGWIARFSGFKIKGNEDVRRAGEIIGVPVRSENGGRGHPLFFFPQWPKEFAEQFERAEDSELAAISAARIRHFIATEGRE